MEKAKRSINDLSSEEKMGLLGRKAYDLFSVTGGQDFDLYHLSVAARQAARDLSLDNEYGAER